jgi:6-phosphogluconolactonase
MSANAPEPRLHVFDDAAAVAGGAAVSIAERAREAIEARGLFTFALSGGSTPRRVYELLAGEEFRTDMDWWPNVHLYFGDERMVPPDHAESNYRMASEALLSKVSIPPENVHRIDGVGDAAANASAYEREMRGLFGDAEWPRLDLVLLGMGDDGHTASLFPGTTALDEKRLWVAPNWVEKLGAWRVTLTAPAINAARRVTFLVTGSGKAGRLREVLKGERDPALLPSQLIRPTDGTLEWFVDREAASGLEAGF